MQPLLNQQEEVFTVTIPANVLQPANGQLHQVQLKPLSVHTFQLIAKAAKDDHALVPLLIVKESVVNPALNINQIKTMKVGLVHFLIKEIKKISGLPTP